MTKKSRIYGALRISGMKLTAMEIQKRCGFWIFPWSALTELEEEGSIESDWIEGPYPRKRVYWVEP